MGHISHAKIHKPMATSLTIHGALVQIYSALFSPWCLCNSFQLPFHSSNSLHSILPAVTHLYLLQGRCKAAAGEHVPPSSSLPVAVSPSLLEVLFSQAGSGLLWSKSKLSIMYFPISKGRMCSPLVTLTDFKTRLGSEQITVQVGVIVSSFL